jgi:hypothetical protein
MRIHGNGKAITELNLRSSLSLTNFAKEDDFGGKAELDEADQVQHCAYLIAGPFTGNSALFHPNPALSRLRYHVDMSYMLSSFLKIWLMYFETRERVSSPSTITHLDLPHYFHAHCSSNSESYDQPASQAP